MLGTHPLVRFLNQNRREIRNVILVVVVFFIVLRFLNSLAEKEVKKQNEITNIQLVETSNANDHKVVIDEFLDFCIKGDESNAYALLSSECKEDFNTLNDFKQNYIQKYFSKDKTYVVTYQSKSDDNYSFQVKILGDMLSTGVVDSNIVIQEFMVEKIGGEYKIIKIK